MNSTTTFSDRALSTVPEVMAMLNQSRTLIYEQIRSSRLLAIRRVAVAWLQLHP
jgi:hypothetical protein